MNRNVQMHLFQSAKETENKLRWDADVDDTRFSLYIPKWRVPEPWPSRIWIDVIPRRAESLDPANLTPADVEADDTLRLEPIVATIERFKEHSQTTRYRPTGDPHTWEIGEPYIPFVLTCERCERLRLIVLWDVTSRGLFENPVAPPV
jgi:hypothetical protein